MYYFDEGSGAIAAMSSVLGITTAVVVLRFGLRTCRKVQFGLDDWSMAASLILVWGLYAVAVHAILYAGTSPYWEYNAYTTGELMLWIGQLLYVSSITTVKVSVLSTYLRIFPTRFVKWGAGIIGTIAIMWFLSTILVSIFLCQPVARSWDLSIPGTCFDGKLFLLGNSIPNILTDMAILCLPIYEVYHLQVSLAKKLGLCLVFMLGSLVVIVSIYRLRILIEIHSNTSESDSELIMSMNEISIWTVVEPAAGMISASLPSLGPLFSQPGRLLSCMRSKKAPKRDVRRAGPTLVTIGARDRQGGQESFRMGGSAMLRWL
ncbi:hypothetical protein KVR01_009281 [Diaporthe batatas]|uniref:uncharacterized protein n=1 Tax=Diaporthe batatas TaxID=748121 RepID=UPI001D043B9C|nr:uncharacterized protein KVR01_009281 [Diaporthe batatas]KAG8161017.1 hypothetical protein KVR01_009281 [Diaporthe batatas]